MLRESRALISLIFSRQLILFILLFSIQLLLDYSSNISSGKHDTFRRPEIFDLSFAQRLSSDGKLRIFMTPQSPYLKFLLLRYIYKFCVTYGTISCTYNLTYNFSTCKFFVLMVPYL